MQQRLTVDAKAIAILVLLCALWGLQQVAIKVAVADGLPPFLQAAIRSAVAALLVAAWIGLRQGPRSLRGMVGRGSGWLPGLILAAFFAIEFLTLFPGLKLTTASRGVLFLYTAPFFVALGAHLFLPAERLQPRQALGLLVAFAGVALAFANGLAGGGGSIGGDMLCLVAAMAWAATTIMVKSVPALRRLPAASLLLYQLAGSVPILLAAAAMSGELTHFPTAPALAWIALAYQTVVIAFASYLLWFWLVTHYPATQIAGFTFLTPLFGILAGSWLLGEHASLALLAGLVAIAIGMRLLRPRLVKATAVYTAAGSLPSP